MLRTLCCSFRSISKVLAVFVFLGVIGLVNVWAQEPASSRPVLDVEGNKIFSKQELLGLANKCLDKMTAAYETDQLDYCLHKVTNHMRAKGYLQARFDKTLYQRDESGEKAVVPVTEGALFRVGKIEIENAKIFSPAQILDMINLNPGEIADGEKLGTALFERVKEAYGNLGYIQYTVAVNPEFHLREKAEEGVADFVISIEEGPQFKIRSIKFAGGDIKTNELLRRELMVRDGEVYNTELFSQSIVRMNNTGLYARIDINRDVEYQTDEQAALLDLTIRLKKKIASSVSP
jgi:outer membrane protein insertion porin family